MTKQEILINVFNKLRLTGAVRTKQDFAERIGYNYTCTSGAFNGVERYLNDRFFTRIINAYPQVSEDYIRTGTGEILLEESQAGVPLQQPTTGIVPLASNRTESTANIERLLDIIREQQELTRRQQEQTDKALEQMDALIGIISTITRLPISDKS